MEFKENGNVLTISGATKIVNYALVKKSQQVNKQQFNLPEGSKIVYPDGSKFIHWGNYALLRNWIFDNKIFDRIAIPWNLLYVIND